MSDILVRVVGWPALMVHGDPCVLDRWLWVRRWLRSGPVRTLDAGSGNGGFTAYAASRGNSVVACSFSSDEQVATRERMRAFGFDDVDVRVLDLRELHETSGDLGLFDQILCLETLEHISNDAAVVAQLAGMLRCGGRLIVSVPSADHRPLYSERLSETEDGGHIRWGYTPERLREMLLESGLTPSPPTRISGVVSQRSTNLMRRLGEHNRLLGWAAVAPLRLLVLLDRPLSQRIGFASLSIGIVGIKPH
jgi:SAM-dependent methyltransferase